MKFSIHCIVFCIISCLFLTTCGTQSSKTTDTTLKIISFNIRQSRMGDSGDFSWEHRKDATLKMIAAERPDIIGMQEVQLEQLNFLEENLPLYNKIGVGRDDGIHGDEHMAVFYLKDRFEMQNHGDFWLSETPETPSMGWDAACKRMVTWAKFIDIRAKEQVFFFNTHLDHVGKTAREKSILLILKKFEEIADNNSSIFLIGDFNSTVDDSIFAPILQQMNYARNTAPITDQKATFNGFGSEKNPEIIDYIFYRGATPAIFKTLNGDYGVPFISDHYPISATFTY